MKIAFFEIQPWEKKFIQKNLKGHELLFTSKILDENNADEFSGCEIVSVFIYSKLSKNALSKLSKLKFVTTRSTGFDHIDLKFCTQNMMAVSNVPFYGENTVAEHTFALLLSLSRKVHESIERTRKVDFSLKGLKGFDLKGKTIGVIGTGHIGLHVIRIAKGFQMNVLAYDKYLNHEAEGLLGFKYVSLKELLSKSDVVSLHVPLFKDTRHLINYETLKLMKKGSYLINTARGGLVHTESLIRALNEGLIAGAGLDVLEEEKFVDEEIKLLSELSPEKQKKMLENHLLLRIPSVIITPHNAFNSQEALDRILETTIENISQYFKGGQINEVKNA